MPHTNPGWTCLLVASLMTSCLSMELPPGMGEGVTEHDATAPEGAPVWTAPTLKTGDWFRYSHGGLDPATYQVTATEDEGEGEGYDLRSPGGMITRLSKTLSERGQELEGDPQERVVKAPADVTYHWPLWAGKKWTTHYLRKAPGLDAVAVEVRYHCEAVETIEVPAGRFACLRILRRAGLASGDSRTQTTMFWFAPEIGFFVRRLDHGVLSELVAFNRS